MNIRYFLPMKIYKKLSYYSNVFIFYLVNKIFYLFYQILSHYKQRSKNHTERFSSWILQLLQSLYVHFTNKILVNILTFFRPDSGVITSSHFRNRLLSSSIKIFLFQYSFEGQLVEDKLGENDKISLNESNSSNPRKPSTPVSVQFTSPSSVDESLHDEDAWVPILAVADAEVS